MSDETLTIDTPSCPPPLNDTERVNIREIKDHEEWVKAAKQAAIGQVVNDLIECAENDEHAFWRFVDALGTIATRHGVRITAVKARPRNKVGPDETPPVPEA